MTLKFTDLIQSDYERVLVAYEELSGFNSIVAIHNTRRGPALGGCRYYEYVSHDDQLEDVLKLSKAMTYKNSLAGLNYGGGKATINSKIPKNYTMRDGYDHNMNLSQRRAYSVMKYSLDTLDNDVLLNIRNKYNVNWMQEIIRAVGYSSSKPVRTSFGEEDLLRSKRVQFRIRIDNNDFMEQIRKLQDPSMRGASGTL